jgi:hypothetical protein
LISKVIEESGIFGSWHPDKIVEERTASQSEPEIRMTRMYDLFTATSMCMMVGEWEK